MRRGPLLLLSLALAACDRPSAVPPPVLTLLAPAFEGGSASGGRRCLTAGGTASARVYVHEPSITFTVRGDAGESSVVDVALGPQQQPAREVPPGAAELTYEADPPRGVQELRLTVSSGSFCLSEVALRQP